MASIQQSMNALVGSAFGAATTETYFYRQSPHYQSRQLETQAKRLQNYSEGIDAEDLGEAYGKSRDLQIEAAMLNPKGKVPSHDVPGKKVTKAERARQLIQEIAEENRIEKKQARAEKNALDRLADKINTQIAQQEAHKDRLDILREVASAKERGQLDTMIGRHKNKGDFD